MSHRALPARYRRLEPRDPRRHDRSRGPRPGGGGGAGDARGDGLRGGSSRPSRRGASQPRDPGESMPHVPRGERATRLSTRCRTKRKTSGSCYTASNENTAPPARGTDHPRPGGGRTSSGISSGSERIRVRCRSGSRPAAVWPRREYSVGYQRGYRGDSSDSAVFTDDIKTVSEACKEKPPSVRDADSQQTGRRGGGYRERLKANEVLNRR